MDYSSLYRKCRPKIFDEIIGQEPIIKVLKNQVATNNTGHAYLFSGIRGVGKTSAALVLAKAVNCLSPKDGNPCLACEHCVGENIDIIEMDAASNNSVEDIRDLRENVKFAPASGRKKVYIIDEVHMLSSGAFNALLKTLEEPPSYVIFILATTETHKVPATIRSRCQVFEFGRIPYSVIVHRLKQIMSELAIEYETEALDIIVNASDGSMRDSLSALEQCLSVDDRFLGVKSVEQILSLVGREQILDLIAAVLQKEPKKVIQIFEKFIADGKDLLRLNANMIDVCRDLILYKFSSNLAEQSIRASAELRSKIQQLSEIADLETIVALFNAMVDLSKIIKYSKNKESIMEVSLLLEAYHGDPESIKPDIKKTSEESEGAEIGSNEGAHARAIGESSTELSTESSTKPDADLNAGMSRGPSRMTNEEKASDIAVTKTPDTSNMDQEKEYDGAKILDEIMSGMTKVQKMLLKNPRFALMAGGDFVLEIEGMQESRKATIEYKIKDDFEKQLEKITGKHYNLKLVAVKKPDEVIEKEIDDVKEYFSSKNLEVDIIE